MRSGMIFNIERCSLSDGPGVRTVVFFKGCGLACAWCHNPESHFAGPQLLYYAEKCTRCGHCAAACPKGALGPGFSPDRTRCVGCGCCAEVCPAQAKRITGQRMDAFQVLKAVLPDKPFYDASGGGVTFSGGECMLQIDFLNDLLIACKDHGLSTAVDTAGDVPFERFERIIKCTDLFLYDIKCVTPSLHQRLTGVDNSRILDNYKHLQRMAPGKMIVRIPVVPGFNTVEDELSRIARFLKEYPPAGYELLPYHALGNAKRRALGLEPFMAEQPDDKAMEAYRECFSPACSAWE